MPRKSCEKLLVALEEKSGGHQSWWDSSSEERIQNLWQSVQYLMRHFNLDKNPGLTDR